MTSNRLKQLIFLLQKINGKTLVGLFLLGFSFVYAQGTYLKPSDYIRQTFADSASPPKAKTFWLTAKHKGIVKKILGHNYPSLRIRYWKDNKRSLWILEEIGKEKPITTGFVVNDGSIEDVKVLIYRESRGQEVKHEFFTKQFKSAKLKENHELDRHINGISGATLSVRALEKCSRLALYLAEQV